MNNEEFVNTVKEYIVLDDQIKEAMKDIKIVKERKSELSLKILELMKTADIDCCNLESGSKLVVKKSKTTAALKPAMIQDELTSYIKNKEDIEKFMEGLKNKRPIKEKDTLSRTKQKK